MTRRTKSVACPPSWRPKLPLKGHHGGSAPAPAEIFPLAAGHCTPAIAPANHERGLEDGWKNDHAVGLVEQVFGNVVRNIQNLFQDRAAILQPVFILFFVARQC